MLLLLIIKDEPGPLRPAVNGEYGSEILLHLVRGFAEYLRKKAAAS